ncbi:MAG: hypothetical protein V1689_06025 [Pseudomonadota bacterium]
MELEGKVGIVIGAARGIGRAITLDSAREEMKIAASGRCQTSKMTESHWHTKMNFLYREPDHLVNIIVCPLFWWSSNRLTFSNFRERRI